MDSKEFINKTTEEKIGLLINNMKDTLMSGGIIQPSFYLFDVNDNLRVIKIKDKKLLKEDRSSMLKQLVKEKIRDLSGNIETILFFREGYYSKKHPDKNNMNLDSDFNNLNSNEALIVSIEDEYEFKLRIFDLIKINDKGKHFSVLSENPIEELSYYKIDPDCNIKTNYINLI